MSLILDALKRAERERRSDGGVTPPAEVPAPAPRAPRAAPPWRMIAIAVAGVAVLAAAALGGRAFRERPPAAPAADAPPAPPPVIMARPAPPEPDAGQPAIVPGTESV